LEKTAIREMTVRILIGAVGVYAILCVLLYLFQNRLIFFPKKGYDATPADYGLPFEKVRLTAADGVRIAAWVVRTPASPFWVLFFHGNAGNNTQRIPYLAFLHSLGVNALLPDYRGYGESEGRPTERGVYLDAEAAWKWLTEKEGVPPEKIVIWGRSLGGGPACHLAPKVNPAGLVLESTFTSVKDMARRMFPVFPVSLIVRTRFDNASKIADVRCPVMVIHGPADTLVPYRLGRRLFELANEPKEFMEIRGNHNDTYSIDDEQCRRRWRAFLRRCFGEAYSPP